MDVLTLAGLQYHANHGYYPKERKEGNDFEVDLIFRADLQAAAADDDLSKTIDYQQAEKIVQEVMKGTPMKLIETLATKIGEALFDHFSNVEELEVHLRKLNPPLETPTRYAQIIRRWNRS